MSSIQFHPLSITMNAFLTGFCILSALVVTGDALNCEVCYAENRSCESSSQSCNQDNKYDECQSSTTEIYNGGNMTTIFKKSCVLFPPTCNSSLSFSTQNLTMRFQSRCCNSENCNTDTIILPPKNTTKNGVRCPVCEASYSNICDSKGQIMECTGEEIKCINYVGKINERGWNITQIAYRGCTTKEDCEVLAKLRSDALIEAEFQCTPGISTTA
ncbi:phospholipase A2 inhibitor and Ly6/PLAUR domain-containing protein isoform X2 [Microcaecilia unicolor]|uniref:Phospholipase A2 inhibitor and Ly6/PLAUR domain-containing protein-like isoform X2 n=1 Tax=Microcaecilia unicolor TaxID=1415580 RepID=A0A6P7Z0M7_9AMPH|nr:phospholipase A2 inhibitor and Ly6/PLAUR domain-containing protein-like isoform X2 [Microcaecilia unicolor]